MLGCWHIFAAPAASVPYILMSALTLPPDCYTSMWAWSFTRCLSWQEHANFQQGLIVCGNWSAHSPHFGICPSYKHSEQPKYMCNKLYRIWNETAAASVLKWSCQSIWFPWLVIAINRCLIPERALPNIHRVVAPDCFASLQNIIHHWLSVSALCRHHTGQQ